MKCYVAKMTLHSILNMFLLEKVSWTNVGKYLAAM